MDPRVGGEKRLLQRGTPWGTKTEGGKYWDSNGSILGGFRVRVEGKEGSRKGSDLPFDEKEGARPIKKAHAYRGASSIASEP